MMYVWNSKMKAFICKANISAYSRYINKHWNEKILLIALRPFYRKYRYFIISKQTLYLLNQN